MQVTAVAFEQDVSQNVSSSVFYQQWPPYCPTVEKKKKRKQRWPNIKYHFSLLALTLTCEDIS